MNTKIVAVESASAVVPRWFRCCAEWEHNGRDDSDWYVVAYDVVEDRLCRIETGSTRYAHALRLVIPGLVSMTPEMAPKARAALVRMRYSWMRHAETVRVMEPAISTLKPGVRVRLTEAHRCAKKTATTTEEPCWKGCTNGQWVNPRNPKDRRPCFACKGTGKVAKVTREKVRVEETTTITRGKNKGQTKVKTSLAWEEIEAGSCGVAKAQSTFGTFYRNGYQEPDRSNTTIYMVLDDGREVQVPAKKLRLDCEPPSDRAVMAMVEDTTPLPDGGMFNAYYTYYATAGTCF